MEPEIHSWASELKKNQSRFSLATVIRVRGSASARTGSKAIFDAQGKNILGWVGGGCAEAFIGRESLAALEEGRPRIVEVDLDDEVFGVGMPCGGVMDVYIEPYLPRARLRLPAELQSSAALAHMAANLGFAPAWEECPENFPAGDPADMEFVLEVLLRALLRERGLACEPMRKSRGIYRDMPLAQGESFSELLLLGNSRIIEELARLAVLVGWPVRVFGPNLEAKNFPRAAKLENCDADYKEFRPQVSSYVLVASHHRGDAEFLRAALAAEASYVGLVASTKRAGIVLRVLREQGLAEKALAHVFTPAGIEVKSENPAEIALSVFGEMLFWRRGALK